MGIKLDLEPQGIRTGVFYVFIPTNLDIAHSKSQMNKMSMV